LASSRSRRRTRSLRFGAPVHKAVQVLSNATRGSVNGARVCKSMRSGVTAGQRHPHRLQVIYGHRDGMRDPLADVVRVGTLVSVHSAERSWT
jgi:hypothetical protein